MPLMQGMSACPKCNSPVGIELAPGPRIVNMEHSSLLVFEHSGTVVCPGCGITLQPAIAGCENVTVVMMPLQPKSMIQTVGGILTS